MSFTTQVPAYASGIQASASSIQFSIRSGLQLVAVTILDDTQTGGTTITRLSLRPHFNYLHDCVWQTVSEGHHRIQRVQSLRRTLAWTLQIRTNYGQSSTDQSAYGRGTTSQDVSSGDTTLDFHESRHGALALDYINTHTIPSLIINPGMTRARVRQLVHNFSRELRHYNNTLDYLEIRDVDCVGIPMNERICREAADRGQ